MKSNGGANGKGDTENDNEYPGLAAQSAGILRDLSVVDLATLLCRVHGTIGD